MAKIMKSNLIFNTPISLQIPDEFALPKTYLTKLVKYYKLLIQHFNFNRHITESAS